jgi:hypothetical protein
VVLAIAALADVVQLGFFPGAGGCLSPSCSSLQSDAHPY